MIERNLQNVTVRKYGTAFLEAFGMLPLTYFGCIGDNLTDNYANIQVAIDESVKRGLRYIFVPDGIYYYTGKLLNEEKIIFIGNAKTSKIYNDDGEIKIYQMGTQIPYEKGTETLNKTVLEEGYIDIATKTKNGSETILVIEKQAIYVTDGLILLNGALIAENKVYLSEDDSVYINDIQIVKEAIRIHYKVNGAGGTINKTIDWRVR